MPILGTKNPNVNIGGKGVKMGIKVHEFHFRLGIDLNSHFHATCALLEDFEIFENFDHIFKAFSTPKSGYDPVGPKIGLVNTSISPIKHS